jgi:hypothetical protein
MAVGLGLRVHLGREEWIRKKNCSTHLTGSCTKTFPVLSASCPGREVLLKLAQQPADTQLAHLLAHIRRCAPCFDELKELRQKGRIQTR